MPLRTPLTLQYNASFVGNNGAGACTITAASNPAGVRVGDQVQMINGAPTAGGALAIYKPGIDFEQFVTVAGQIRQLSASNLSGSTLVAVLVPSSQ